MVIARGIRPASAGLPEPEREANDRPVLKAGFATTSRFRRRKWAPGPPRARRARRRRDRPGPGSARPAAAEDADVRGGKPGRGLLDYRNEFIHAYRPAHEEESRRSQRVADLVRSELSPPTDRSARPRRQERHDHRGRDAFGSQVRARVLPTRGDEGSRSASEGLARAAGYLRRESDAVARFVMRPSSSLSPDRSYDAGRGSTSFCLGSPRTGEEP